MIAKHPEHDRLAQARRFTPGNIHTYGWDLDYLDAPSLWSCIDVLVDKGWNDFTCDRPDPYILDLGANVGISALHYKRRHPGARIVAFEPDPQVARVLRRNLQANGAADVSVIEAGVWIQSGEMPLLLEGADGSRLQPGGGQGTALVKTVALDAFLVRPVDLLKVDIEGAEYDVIQQLGRKLKLVRNLVIECHVRFEAVADFAGLLATLAGVGFRVAFNTYGKWTDLVRRPGRLPNEFDQYVLVSAWREAS